MNTALERVLNSEEAGSCTQETTMLPSSCSHSRDFSHRPYIPTISEAASDKSVASAREKCANSDLSSFCHVASSQSNRKSDFSSQELDNEKDKDVRNAIYSTIEDLEEVTPHWIRFLFCKGESSTLNSDSDSMSHKDLLLQDLLQVEHNFNLQQSKYERLLQSYSSHSMNSKASNTMANTSNSFREVSLGIPEGRSDMSTETSARSLGEGSSFTTSSRYRTSKSSSDYPKAGYKIFLGRKTNTATTSSDTTSASSSHKLAASYGLSSRSTKSSELDSNTITESRLQYSSFTEASIGIPAGRSDVSTETSARSLGEGSSFTTTSRYRSSKNSSDYPKAGYKIFLGRKTNTATTSSDTTSASSSHKLTASYGLSSRSTKSSELDSNMIAESRLQYSSTSCSSSEVMPYHGLKAKNTTTESTLSASATDNSSDPSYGSHISSTSGSIVESSSATSSRKHSSLCSSSSGKYSGSHRGLKTPSDTTRSLNSSSYRGATFSSITTSSGFTTLSVLSKISNVSKNCSRKIVRYFEDTNKPPLPPRSYTENDATEVSFEQVAKNKSKVPENNNAPIQEMDKQKSAVVENSDGSLHGVPSRESTSCAIPRNTAHNASIFSSQMTSPKVEKFGNNILTRTTIDASTSSSQYTTTLGVSKTASIACKTGVSKDSLVEIETVVSRKTATKDADSKATAKTAVDTSTLSPQFIAPGVTKIPSFSISSSTTGASKDSPVGTKSVVSRKTAAKDGNSVAARKTVDTSTLYSELIAPEVTDIPSLSNAANKTVSFQDSAVETTSVVSRKTATQDGDSVATRTTIDASEIIFNI